MGYFCISLVCSIYIYVGWTDLMITTWSLCSLLLMKSLSDFLLLRTAKILLGAACNSTEIKTMIFIIPNPSLKKILYFY